MAISTIFGLSLACLLLAVCAQVAISVLSDVIEARRASEVARASSIGIDVDAALDAVLVVAATRQDACGRALPVRVYETSSGTLGAVLLNSDGSRASRFFGRGEQGRERLALVAEHWTPEIQRSVANVGADRAPDSFARRAERAAHWAVANRCE